MSGEEPDQHEEEPAAEVESHAEDALSVLTKSTQRSYLSKLETALRKERAQRVLLQSQVQQYKDYMRNAQLD